MGRLAGAVAHDFNNLLAVVLTFAEVARLSVPEDSPATGDLDEIAHAALRGAGLTRRLLSIAGRGGERPCRCCSTPW